MLGGDLSREGRHGLAEDRRIGEDPLFQPVAKAAFPNSAENAPFLGAAGFILADRG
jgi:hypothetical protein